MADAQKTHPPQIEKTDKVAKVADAQKTQKAEVAKPKQSAVAVREKAMTFNLKQIITK